MDLEASVCPALAAHKHARVASIERRWASAQVGANFKSALLDRLFRPAAKIVDQAYLAARLPGETGVAAVQDQPVMGVQHELRRDHLFEPQLDLERRLARRQPGAI